MAARRHTQAATLAKSRDEQGSAGVCLDSWRGRIQPHFSVTQLNLLDAAVRLEISDANYRWAADKLEWEEEIS